MSFNVQETHAGAPAVRLPAVRSLLKRWPLTGRGAIGAALLLLALASLGMGPVAVSPAQTLAILADALGLTSNVSFDISQQATVLSLRLPRLLLAGAVGATLALSGAVLQGLFRNPLADPHLLGISMGGAVGASVMILLGLSWAPAATLMLAYGEAVIPLGAFVGGLAAMGGVLVVAGGSGRATTAQLLLGGIAINAMGGALLGLILHLANDAALRSITAWTLGSVAGATWPALKVALPLLALAAFVCLREAGTLNALLLGHAEAEHLGVDVAGVQRRLVLGAALGVGTAVALSGIIAFVGLLVPHVYRLVSGPNHLHLLPGSALLGATMMIGADLAARTAIAPQELPVGVVTALLGAPFFIGLLRRRGGRP